MNTAPQPRRRRSWTAWAAAVLVGASALLTATGGAASAQVTKLPAAEAHCYSVYGARGDVSLGVYDNTSPYQRMVRMLYRNNGAENWRPATAWHTFNAGDVGSFVEYWDVPAGRSGWHQYAVEEYAQTADGWEYQGNQLASAFNALTPGGTQHPSPYAGWCYA